MRIIRSVAAATVMVLVSAVLLRAAPAQALDLVVVRASGTPLAPGDTVPSDQPFSLREGQTVSLLAPSGLIIDLAGPHDALPLPAAKERDSDVLRSLKGLIEQRTAGTDSLGATRVTTLALPDPWVVSVDNSGTRCVRAGEELVLWRSDASEDAPISIERPRDGWTARATWPAGSQKLAAPPALDTPEGERLRVSFPTGATDLVIHTVPASLSTDAMRLAWLVDKGCDGQAASLARAVP